MSGLFGVALRSDAVVEAEALQSMGEAIEAVPLGTPPPGERDRAMRTRVHGPIGLGVVSFHATRSSVAEIARPRGALVAAFHGNLYDGSGLALEEDPAVFIASRYEGEGLNFLRSLRGDFALAIWDQAEGRLHLAVDPFRVQSLVYAVDRGALAFGSHMRALLAGPVPFSRSIDPRAVLDVIAASYIPTPRTIFRHVAKLPAGSVLTWRGGEARITPYWDMDYLHPDGSGEKVLARRLHEVLERAVARRLEAEPAGAEVGTFLSGGVDSTAVTRLVARMRAGRVPSFSIGFAERHWNEMDFARIAARAAGVQHHEYFVTPEDAYAAVPTVIEAFDEPFANASAIPTYFCARLAREHGVSILYAGDGGDELFAGNERYVSRRVLDHYDRVPRWIRERVVTPGVRYLADRIPVPALRRARNYVRRAGLPYPERITSLSLFDYIPLRTLFTDALLDAAGPEWEPGAMIHHHYRAARARTVLDRELYLDLKLVISDNDLFKVVRMTRAAGVAVRFPFLDRDLAEFASTVPARLMVRGGTLRAFFKRSCRDLLPPEIVAKRKHGFGLPIAIWLGTHPPFREMLEDLLLSRSAIERGYVRPEGLTALLDGHRDDPKGYYGTFLWNLMLLELWMRRVNP